MSLSLNALCPYPFAQALYACLEWKGLLDHANDMSGRTQLCALVLRDAQLSLRQLSADLIDLLNGIAVLEARKLSAVVARLVVDFGVVGLAARFLELVQHEGDLCGREGLLAGHFAQFEALGGFFFALWWWSAARGGRGCGLGGGLLGACHGGRWCLVR